MDELAECFQILGIKPPVSEEQVKAAYRDLVKVWHPDRFAHDERLRLKAQDKLKEINGAYQVVLASLFDTGTATAGATPSAAPPPEATEPPPPPPAATRRPWSLVFAALGSLVLVAGLWLWWEKSHEASKLVVNSQPPTTSPSRSVVPLTSTNAWRRGLLVDFHFDKELAGENVPDLSGHGNDGHASGVKWVAGEDRGGLAFGPGKSSIRVPNNDALNSPQFTLAVWIKTTQKDALWHRLFDKGVWEGNNSEVGYDLTLGGIESENGKSYQGQVLLEVSTHATLSDIQVTDGMWHHIAGAFDGVTLQYYVDGQLAAEKNVAKAMQTAPYDLTIGYPCTDPPKEANTTGYTGLMNDVMVFNRALTAREIRDVFESQGGALDPADVIKK